MTEPQPAADLPPATDLRPGLDPVARIEAATAQLSSAEHCEAVPLTELAEQLAALHQQLQSALSELDRT